jgi:hypothetical protein
MDLLGFRQEFSTKVLAARSWDKRWITPLMAAVV